MIGQNLLYSEAGSNETNPPVVREIFRKLSVARSESFQQHHFKIPVHRKASSMNTAQPNSPVRLGRGCLQFSTEAYKVCCAARQVPDPQSRLAPLPSMKQELEPCRARFRDFGSSTGGNTREGVVVLIVLCLRCTTDCEFHQTQSRQDRLGKLCAMTKNVTMTNSATNYQ